MKVGARVAHVDAVDMLRPALAAGAESTHQGTAAIAGCKLTEVVMTGASCLPHGATEQGACHQGPACRTGSGVCACFRLHAYRTSFHSPSTMGATIAAISVADRPPEEEPLSAVPASTRSMSSFTHASGAFSARQLSDTRC